MSAAASPDGSEELRFSRSRLLGRGAILGLSALGAGALASPSTAKAQTMGGEFDLLSLGAVGDGIADDTGAFARALNAMSPGTKLVSPQGRTFRISSTLVIDRPCSIDLRGSTVVKSRGMNGVAFVVASDGVQVGSRSARIADIFYPSIKRGC